MISVYLRYFETRTFHSFVIQSLAHKSCLFGILCPAFSFNFESSSFVYVARDSIETNTYNNNNYIMSVWAYRGVLSKPLIFVCHLQGKGSIKERILVKSLC